MSRPRVEIHIAELALTGVADHERPAVVAALRTELTRALAERPGRSLAAPAAPIPVLAPVAGPTALGAAAGRALARGLEG